MVVLPRFGEVVFGPLRLLGGHPRQQRPSKLRRVCFSGAACALGTLKTVMPVPAIIHREPYPLYRGDENESNPHSFTKRAMSVCRSETFTISVEGRTAILRRPKMDFSIS